MILFQMLTGKLNIAPVARFDRELPGVPQYVVDLIGDCVETDKAKRPADAAAILAKLVPPPEPEPVARTPKVAVSREVDPIELQVVPTKPIPVAIKPETAAQRVSRLENEAQALQAEARAAPGRHRPGETPQVDQAKVAEDMENVDKMVDQFKEPALRRYAGAKLVGTFVSAAGVAAGVVGVLAMGVAPSLGAAACLAAPVIKYTIDKICSGWRTESYQSTINKAIKEASGAGSWIEQLAHTKALINIVNKFARPTKDREKIVEKLTEEANKIEDKIRGQKDFEQRTELFPVSHREIHSPKGAGGKLLLVMDLAFYAGTAASIGSFYSEMISYGNQIVSWLGQVYRLFV